MTLEPQKRRFLPENKEWWIYYSILFFSTAISGINLYFFEKVSCFGTIISLIEHIVNYGFWSLFVFAAAKNIDIEKLNRYIVAIIHIVLALIYGLLLEFSTYSFIILAMPESQEKINLLKQVFGQVHWKTYTHMVIYLSIVLFYYLLNYLKRYHQQKEVESQLRVMLLDSQLETLKYQLNPHFLFNTLNSIYALIESDAKKAREMLLLSSDFLRFTLSIRDKELILLKDELEQCKRYLSIEEIRFKDRLSFQIDNLCPESTEIPSLLLQPLLENAIKHSVSKSKKSVSIQIKARNDAGQTQISVSNPFVETSNAHGTGLGLENIRKRLHLHFPNAELRIEKTDYFTVYLIY